MQLMVLRIIDFQGIDDNGCGSLVLTREKTPFTPFNEYRYKSIKAKGILRDGIGGQL
jgi:hypothetical protein